MRAMQTPKHTLIVMYIASQLAAGADVHGYQVWGRQHPSVGLVARTKYAVNAGPACALPLACLFSENLQAFDRVRDNYVACSPIYQLS